MKTRNYLAATLAGLFVLGASTLPAFGQAGGRPLAPGAAPVAAAPAARPAPSGTSVAVIDLQEVFKQNLRFKAAMEDIKRDTEALNAQMRGEQKKLQTMVEDLKAFKPGTADYKQREEEIAHVDSEVRVKLQLQRKDLRDREAKMYYHAYNEVIANVEQFAERYGIALVIRFNAEEIDPTNPESIMMGLNRHVVFQRSLNITDAIIQQMNQGVAPTANRTAPVIPGRPGLK